MRGLSHDNGEVEAVEVNGRPAAIFARHAGVADWEIALDGAAAQGDTVTARARDRAGNEERMPHAAAIRAIRGRSGRF